MRKLKRACEEAWHLPKKPIDKFCKEYRANYNKRKRIK